MTSPLLGATPSLARNTILNLLGLGAPLLVALFAIPVLTRTLGTDRFGILTLIWVVVGYFSLFDLGLGRAVTQVVSQRVSMGRLADVPETIWTTLGLMLGLGLITSLVAAALSAWLVQHALRVPASLEVETLHAFYLLTLSVPVVMVSTGLQGVLEAHHRFDLVNWVRAPMGAFTYLGPLVVLPFVSGLVPIVAVLIIGRLVALGVYLGMCLNVMPSLGRRPRIVPSLAPPLLRLGSWMSVSNLVGPILINLDRFVLGSIISISVVAFYTVPYEIATRILLVPVALASVLFPTFAGTYASDRVKAGSLFSQGLTVMWLILFPVITLVVAFAHDGLLLWLGSEFALKSTAVLQWLAVGVLINSLAHVPFALIQGAGRPDLTAKLHLIELPFYLAWMWWLITVRGVEGAAMAWTLRASVDAVALAALARHPLGVTLAPLKRLAPVMAIGLAALGLVASEWRLAPRVALVTATIGLLTAAGWYWLLTTEDRARLRARIAAFSIRN